MKKLLIIGMLAVLSACSGPNPGSPAWQYRVVQEQKEQRADTVHDAVSDLPSWYLKSPQDEYSIYSSGMASSGDAQMAIDKAIMLAKNGIAQKLSSKLSSEMKDYMSDSGRVDNPVTLQKSERTVKEVVAEAELAGYDVTKKELKASGGVFIAYAMVRYPLGDANKILSDKIKSDADLSLHAQASKAFSELEKDIQASRDIKASERPIE